MKNDTQIKKVEIVAPAFNIETLISQAVTSNAPVESLERLLAMRKELKAEWAKSEYDKAMAKFQEECPTIEKKVKGYNYMYADLTSIIEQVKPLLAENGFSYTFDTDEVEGAIMVYCKVKHIAGHSEISKSKISKETTSKMNVSQQSGAAMTYGKRYAFVNAFGILTGDEDTDAATPKQKTQTAPPNNTKQKEEVKVAKDTCSECHAPSGRLHATRCSLK